MEEALARLQEQNPRNAEIIDAQLNELWELGCLLAVPAATPTRVPSP